MARRARHGVAPPPSQGGERGGVTRLALARHLESFTRYSGDILLLFDPEGRLVEANERAVEAYGHPRAALMAMGVDDLCAAGGVGDVRRRLAGAPAEGVAYEAVHRRADGSRFPVEVSARLITIEGSTYLQAIVRDISERKRAEETLAYQAMLLANMNEAVMGLDDKFLLRAWNRAAERIYGWRSEEVMGRPILRLLDTQYHRGFDQAMLSRLQEDGRIRLEMRQVRKDGTPIEVEGVSVALRDPAGRITSWNLEAERITGAKAAEVLGLSLGDVVPGARAGALDAQNRVTDHRIGLTLYNLAEIIDGRLDQLLEALKIADRTERLKVSGTSG